MAEVKEVEVPEGYFRIDPKPIVARGYCMLWNNGTLVYEGELTKLSDAVSKSSRVEVIWLNPVDAEWFKNWALKAGVAPEPMQ